MLEKDCSRGRSKRIYGQLSYNVMKTARSLSAKLSPADVAKDGVKHEVTGSVALAFLVRQWSDVLVDIVDC